MRRHSLFLVLLMTLCIVLFAGLVVVSNQVQEKRAELQDVQAQRQDLKDETRALKAEWSYLTRPQRLEKMRAGGDVSESKVGLD